MAKGIDYKLKKLEKGPLARFKNQNLLIKKFGETGLQVYRAITGKRTAQELRKDLGVEESLFNEILDYMKDCGMVELEPPEGGKAAPEEEVPAAEREASLEELPPAEEAEEGVPPLEEKPAPGRKKPAKPVEMAFEEITPIELGPETTPAEEAEGKIRPSARRKRKTEEVPEGEITAVEEEGGEAEAGEQEGGAETENPETGEEAPPEEAPPEETAEAAGAEEGGRR
jgi:hypothetical protein